MVNKCHEMNENGVMGQRMTARLTLDSGWGSRKVMELKKPIVGRAREGHSWQWK